MDKVNKNNYIILIGDMTVIVGNTKITIFILVNNQLDAQNLFYNKFISCLYMFRAPCARRQEVKIVLYSIWYHHTETSEWSKITKITKITNIYTTMCSYLYILVILVILVISDHSLVSV